MFINKLISKRHFLKTISWRLVGTIDTFLLSYLIFGEFSVGVKISVLDLLIKSILYYFHEIFWFNSSFSRSATRHIYKTISWRIIGSTNTFLLGWIFFGNPFFATQLSIAEIVTKMILYYLHEKVWYKFKFGLNKRQ